MYRDLSHEDFTLDPAIENVLSLANLPPSTCVNACYVLQSTDPLDLISLMLTSMYKSRPFHSHRTISSKAQLWVNFHKMMFFQLPMRLAASSRMLLNISVTWWVVPRIWVWHALTPTTFTTRQCSWAHWDLQVLPGDVEDSTLISMASYTSGLPRKCDREGMLQMLKFFGTFMFATVGIQLDLGIQTKCGRNSDAPCFWINNLWQETILSLF